MAKKEKKPKEKKPSPLKKEAYKTEGNKIEKTKTNCPKCGEGVFLAEHKNRHHCGQCGYTRWKKQ